MDTKKEADGTVVMNELVIGESDVVEDVPAELVRVIAANSAALEQLPGQLSVNVPSNKG
jgi:hypothetical protein